jgi:hypothetical protein
MIQVNTFTCQVYPTQSIKVGYDWVAHTIIISEFNSSKLLSFALKKADGQLL